MTAIIDIHARQILDSRGNPTVEVEMMALAPAGVSLHFHRMAAGGGVPGALDNQDARTGAPLSDTIKDGKGLGVKVSPLEFIKKRHADRKDAKALLDMNDGLGS